MPNLIYTPLYAPLVAYWFWSGDLKSPSTDFPYGFQRPLEQMGALIEVGRAAGLLIGLFSMAVYGRSLFLLTGSRLAVFLALMLCMALSPPLIVSFVSTKPDGLMLAFLAVSMAAYAQIVSSGLTRGRGFILSLFAVFSISCKELTAPVYVFPYAAIAILGWFQTRAEAQARRRFLADFGFTVATGVVAYLVVNVVYAPATWLERVRWFRGSSGPDAAVWAPPGYTTRDYSRDIISGLMYDLGLGGAAIAMFALAFSLLAPIRNRILLWLPAFSFFTLAVLKLGYMPSYLLLPMNVLLALPVAAALTYARARWFTACPVSVQIMVGALIGVLCAVNAWAANYSWALSRCTCEALEERYVRSFVGKHELVSLGNIWVTPKGASRLSHLGYNIDNRSLMQLMSLPNPMPDVVLIHNKGLAWLEDVKRLPARNRMLTDGGGFYVEFPGYEALGYVLVDRYTPKLEWPLNMPGIPRWVRMWYPTPENAAILVYRKAMPTTGNPSAPPRLARPPVRGS
jgi:hypothetical protein